MEIRALDELENRLRLLIDHLQSVKEENQRLRQQVTNQSGPEIQEAVKNIQAGLQRISGWIDEALEADVNNEHGE
jgi:DNA anti-recombination protein RmuC